MTAMANWRRTYERRTGRRISDRDVELATAYGRLHDRIAGCADVLAVVCGGRRRVPRTLRKYLASARPSHPESPTASHGIKRKDDLRPFLRMNAQARAAEVERLRGDYLLVLKMCRLLLNTDAAARRVKETER